MTKYIEFVKVHDMGKIQNPSYEGDAGFNLVCCQTTELKPLIPTNIHLGVEVALPAGMSAMFVTRSHAISKGIFVFPTLIDSGYRGLLWAYAINFGAETQIVLPGVSIVQLLPVLTLADDIRVVETNKLPESIRGNRGFGSSGGAML
jgi:dUTPase